MDTNDNKPFRLLCNIPLLYLPEMTKIVLMTMAKMATDGEVILQDQYFKVAENCVCIGMELSDDGRKYEVWVQESPGKTTRHVIRLKLIPKPCWR